MWMKSKDLFYRNLDRSKKHVNFSKAQEEYLKACKREKKVVRSLQLLIFVLFLTIWEAGARTGLINAFVFSSPTRVWNTMLTMAKDGSLWYHTGITLAETFVSLFLVMLFGIGIAVLLWWNTRLSDGLGQI